MSSVAKESGVTQRCKIFFEFFQVWQNMQNRIPNDRSIYSSLYRTSELYKTKKLSRVEKEDVMYRIKANIFKSWKSI
jgi:hypothetical protein